MLSPGEVLADLEELASGDGVNPDIVPAEYIGELQAAAPELCDALLPHYHRMSAIEEDLASVALMSSVVRARLLSDVATQVAQSPGDGAGRMADAQALQDEATWAEMHSALMLHPLNGRRNFELHAGELRWVCGCGEVQIKFSAPPKMDYDCHGADALPVAQFLNSKSHHEGTNGTSAISASGKGVAKTFFQLDAVSIARRARRRCRRPGRAHADGILLMMTSANVPRRGRKRARMRLAPRPHLHRVVGALRHARTLHMRPARWRRAARRV